MLNILTYIVIKIFILKIINLLYGFRFKDTMKAIPLLCLRTSCRLLSTISNGINPLSGTLMMLYLQTWRILYSELDWMTGAVL